MSESKPITVHSNAYRQPIRTNIDYIFKHSIMKETLWDPDTVVNICKYFVDGTDFFTKTWSTSRNAIACGGEEGRLIFTE